VGGITGLYFPYILRCFEVDLREVGCEGLDWIELAQERDRCRAFVNVVMNLRVQ
jgi:hypothetical protein